MLRHPYQVSIVSNGVNIIVAKRSTPVKADAQAASIRESFGNGRTASSVDVIVTDLNAAPQPTPARPFRV